MADQFTETSTTGYFSRIGKSFFGILIGIVLIIASVWVLFSNEGRVDLSKIAKTAVEISSTAKNTDQTLNGKFVSASGPLTTNDLIGDGLYLKPGRYLMIRRRVEMYAWEEKESSKTKKNLGGSETTETTYTYVKDWNEYPESSSKFKHPEGHANPGKAYDSVIKTAPAAKLGVYALNTSSIGLPEMEKISPTGSEYVFYGKGALAEPELGDLRISYFALPSGKNATVFGKLDGDKIVAYPDEGNIVLYRALSGSRAEAIDTLRGEYKTMLWIMRLVGFLMMWIGLGLLVAPISVILDVLPMLGSVNRFVLNAIAFLIAFVASAIIIIFSMIVHNLVLVIIILGLIAAAAIMYLRKKK